MTTFLDPETTVQGKMADVRPILGSESGQKWTVFDHFFDQNVGLYTFYKQLWDRDTRRVSLDTFSGNPHLGPLNLTGAEK